jgi:hypothetical protein
MAHAFSHRPDRKANGGIQPGSDYDTARTRKINAEAQIAELHLAHARMELCKTADVIDAWRQVCMAFKTRLTAIPAKMAPMLANEGDPATIKALLEDVMIEALAELANYRPDVDPVKTAASEAVPVEEQEAPPKRKRGRPSKVAKAKEAAGVV